MAFEDRSSPNAATSPVPGSTSTSSSSTSSSAACCNDSNHGNNNFNTNLNQPNSPESTRTCASTETSANLINPNKHLHLSAEPSIFRIASFALPNSPKRERDSHSCSPASGCCVRSPSPVDSVLSSNFSITSPPSLPAPPQTPPPPPPPAAPPNNNDSSNSLRYSIQNILQPDFGKSAISRRTPKISFRPYEPLVTTPPVPLPPQPPPPLLPLSLDDKQKKIFDMVTAPLGSLCQTVSQIGRRTTGKSLSLSAPSPSSSSSSASSSPSCSLSSCSSFLLSKSSSENQILDKSKTTTTPATATASLPNPEEIKQNEKNPVTVWPAWVYCTRYSDRPSSGPRSRRMKKPSSKTDDKRPRTAFSSAQLARLKHEFNDNRYLTEARRQKLSTELGLNEAQIKIWFQNKRAKIKKSSGQKNALALQLMAQGLYNHSTVPCDEDDMPIES